MKANLMRWFLAVIFSISALTGCFVSHSRDDSYRDRDGYYDHDRGDRHDHREDRDDSNYRYWR